MVKKKVKQMWDYLTTVLVSIFLLIIAVAMASGGFSVTGVAWLAWMQPAVAVVGWIFIVLSIANIATSTWNLFMK